MKMQRIYIPILAFWALIGCSNNSDRMIESFRITYYVENTPKGSITYNFYDSELLKLIFFETEKDNKTFFVNWDGTKSTEEKIKYGVMQSHGLDENQVWHDQPFTIWESEIRFSHDGSVETIYSTLDEIRAEPSSIKGTVEMLKDYSIEHRDEAAVIFKASETDIQQVAAGNGR